MDRIDRLEAIHACTDLVNNYATYLDDYNYDAFMGLWVDAPELDMLGNLHQGLNAIRGWLDGREKDMICRHLVTNITTQIHTPDDATGRCYTLAFRAPNAAWQPPGALVTPTFLVNYRSEFRRDPARGWLFSRRSVTADLAGPDQMRALFLNALHR